MGWCKLRPYHMLSNVDIQIYTISALYFCFLCAHFFGPCCHVFVLVVTCCIIVALAGCIAHAAYNVVHGSEFGVGFSSPADEPREWDVLPIFP
jgi:hypothetical protein